MFRPNFFVKMCTFHVVQCNPLSEEPFQVLHVGVLLCARAFDVCFLKNIKAGYGKGSKMLISLGGTFQQSINHLLSGHHNRDRV